MSQSFIAALLLLTFIVETVQISVQCQGGAQPVCPCTSGCPPATSCQQNVGCCPVPQTPAPQRTLLH